MWKMDQMIMRAAAPVPVQGGLRLQSSRPPSEVSDWSGRKTAQCTSLPCCCRRKPFTQLVYLEAAVARIPPRRDSCCKRWLTYRLASLQRPWRRPRWSWRKTRRLSTRTSRRSGTWSSLGRTSVSSGQMTPSSSDSSGRGNSTTSRRFGCWHSTSSTGSRTWTCSRTWSPQTRASNRLWRTAFPEFSLIWTNTAGRSWSCLQPTGTRAGNTKVWGYFSFVILGKTAVLWIPENKHSGL